MFDLCMSWGLPIFCKLQGDEIYFMKLKIHGYRLEFKNFKKQGNSAGATTCTQSIYYTIFPFSATITLFRDLGCAIKLIS